MKITDFENRRSFKCIWLNSQFREEVSEAAVTLIGGYFLVHIARLGLWCC